MPMPTPSAATATAASSRLMFPPALRPRAPGTATICHGRLEKQIRRPARWRAGAAAVSQRLVGVGDVDAVDVQAEGVAHEGAEVATVAEQQGSLPPELQPPAQPAVGVEARDLADPPSGG